MCLIAFSFRERAEYPFVFVSNRDEFLDRPAAPMHFWEDAPDLLAGRDLRGGGTWLGLTRAGRFATVTNYREVGRTKPDAPTRGRLPVRFLLGDDAPAAFLDRLAPEADRYNGFNLLVGAGGALHYYSNRGARRALAPGLYGLSNHLLDTPWPKVVRAKTALRTILDEDRIEPEALFALLADETKAPDDALPDTGVGLEWERLLSSIFIRSPKYGTRASTVILTNHQGKTDVYERTFPPDGSAPFTRHFHLPNGIP
ncbi:NRDE family protein [Rhodocaloribacter sp.]